MAQGTIFTNITNKIATITFFHPSSNSFPSALINKLIDSFDRLSQDENVHVIVLKSDGDKAFCAGASFDELLQVESLEEGIKFFSGFANLINAMRKCEKLIIGRVQGKTVGGGVGIIAATDYSFATEAADVKLSELSIGIGPFVIAPALERKIGVSALSELTIDAINWKTAYWAKEKGLYARVFENSRDMDEAVDILSNKLVSYNLRALTEMKKALWHDTSHWDELLLKNAEISGKLALSDYTKNALLKFKK